MVRAILDGRKTQTRRVIKPQPRHIVRPEDGGSNLMFFSRQGKEVRSQPIDIPDNYPILHSPYGAPGDRLWVREAWYKVPISCSWNGLPSKTSPDLRWSAFYRTGFDRSAPRGCKPSIHMPRWASRITLEVMNIRVQRLQEVCEYEATLEGTPEPTGRPGCYPAPWATYVPGPTTYIESFAKLWDKINEKRGYSWESNPWVWVIQFKRAQSG
mgnify:FL=1